MENVNIAIQLDLAVHLALLALVTTFLGWSFGSLPSIFRQLTQLRRLASLGHLGRDGSYLAGCKFFELLLRIFGSALSLRVGLHSLSYLETAELLVGAESSSYDYGLYMALWRTSEGYTESALALTGTIAILTLLTFAAEGAAAPLEAHVGLRTERRLSHVFWLPREWRMFPQALWESRIRFTIETLNGEGAESSSLETALDSASWRNDWRSWCEIAAAYRTASEKTGWSAATGVE